MVEMRYVVVDAIFFLRALGVLGRRVIEVERVGRKGLKGAESVSKRIKSGR